MNTDLPANSRKMRIAVWHNLPSGGAKRALWNHVSGLLQRGHQVESWCPETADKNYLPLSKLCREHVLPLGPSPLPWLPKPFGWVASFRQMQARIAAMRAHCAACATEIQAGGFDILFANTCADLTVSPIARYVTLPKVIYLQEPYRHHYETLAESPWVAPKVAAGAITPSLGRLTSNSLKLQYRRVQMREEQDNARYFDRILANSAFSRESILRAYGLDSEVCYLGVDTNFFHPTHEPVEKYLVGLGAVDYQKGVSRAIEALGVVPAAIRPKLLWIGNNANSQYQALLKERAKQLGVDFEVRVMVQDAELISLLSRAAAMLYTSWLEPFGFAPLEANACGTPAIAIAEGGIRETIVDGENGLLIPHASPPAMAAVIQHFLENPPVAAALRAKCRQVVQTRWSLEAAAERLEKALLEVVDLSARKARSLPS